MIGNYQCLFIDLLGQNLLRVFVHEDKVAECGNLLHEKNMVDEGWKLHVLLIGLAYFVDFDDD